MTQRNLWGEVAHVFDLPDQLSQPQTNGNSSVALVLAQIYMHILTPFEEAYRKNAQQQQQRIGARPSNASQYPPGSGPSGTAGPTQQLSLGPSTGFPVGSQAHGLPGGPMGPMGQTGGGTMGSQYPPQVNQLAQGVTGSSSPTLSGGIPQSASTDSMTQEGGVDGEGRKRKSRDADEDDGKRTRIKTGTVFSSWMELATDCEK